MITVDKPPLEAVYLAHFGIKGMKWGQRKAKSSGEQKQGMSTAKKVAIGTAVVAGVTATAIILRKFGGTKIPAPSLTPKLSLPKPGLIKSADAYHPNVASYMRRVDSGQMAHRRAMNLLQYKKTELDNAASLARIDKLLKQPTPKMPSFERLAKADRRSARVASVKRLFNRSAKPPLQLFPAQSMFKSS